jgi:O-antigen chain-terminating methyltransferase
VESAELIAILREVRERVRARYPATSAGASGIALPDLEPLVRARDAAMAKVAAIGTVNPRRGGPFNTLVQGWKRLVARALDWHVREQVIFNRQALACIDAAVETLAETNRALAQLGDRLATQEKLGEELKDIRNHWAEWRAEWEHKLQQNEVQFLRSVADLQAAFSHRADLMDANYRDTVRAQHADFDAALARSNAAIQSQLIANMERVKLDYERLIHTELRLIRQRLAPEDALVPQPDASLSPTSRDGSPAPLDYTRFAERFRGPEEHVKALQRDYLPHFAGRREVLDIGCGRGEFLELMREAGIPARGIDLSAECVAMCREKGLEAQTADLFTYLRALPEESLDGIFCAQVVEHLPPERLPQMIGLCASRLSRGGVLAVETPNPECLAIFSTYFFLDPTHVRPVPRQWLEYCYQENGLGVVEIRKLSPAVDSMPALTSLPEDFREAFFGGLDYAVVGKKLTS